MKKTLLIAYALLFSCFIYSQSTVQTFTTTGSGTWNVPCGVTSVTVEVWGAGGGGQRTEALNTAGGGGSGGGYVKTVYNIPPGTTSISYFVGTGGTANASTVTHGQSSWFVNNTTILAVGGRSASVPLTSPNNVGNGAIALTSGNIGGTLVSTYGGNGGNGILSPLTSGGGGSSAGNTDGNSAVNATGGAAPTNGYAGANGTSTGSTGVAGGFGAGGSGARTSPTATTIIRSGGVGGKGQIRLTYTVPTYPTYCTKTFSTVEPITNVTFAGINNTTSNLTTSPAEETFCLIASVHQGNTYTVSLKGNTVGDYVNYFRIYIDWDRNGTYGNNANEIYNIGTITNSTGIDSSVLIGNISVPATASLGLTGMRVVKNYDAYTDACTAASYGQSENYLVEILSPAPCTGTPTGGTTTLTPTTGLPSSNFSATVTGASGGSGITYQWYSGPSATGPWTAVTGATNETANIQAISTPGTMYYTREIICTASGQNSFSTPAAFVTKYCTPTTTVTNNGGNYINTVSFLGTLQDYTQTSTYSTTTPGYQDFTGNTTKTIQAQGGGINVYVNNLYKGITKAWVDWNKDGDFDDAGEQVYTSGNINIFSTTFGIAVPSTITPGDYTIRIRSSFTDDPNNNINFTNCENMDFGEAEDYLITIISNCPYYISKVTDAVRCGTGTLTLQATSTTGVTQFKWWSARTGGTLLGTTAASGISSNWTTPSISTTTIYYVSATNGTCESLERVPVKATVKPTPNIVFNPESGTACGENSVIEMSAAGGNEVEYLIDEDFESGTLGSFTGVIHVSNGTTLDDKTKWQNRTSTYIPAEKVWFPAISSGINYNRFAMSNSDIGQDANNVSYITNNSLTSSLLNTSNFINLTLKFRMYFSRYVSDPTNTVKDIINIEASTDGGTNWNNVGLINYDVGIGTRFDQLTYDLTPYINQPNLKIRFRYFASYNDGVAIDDIELFGEKPISTSFNWTTSSPIDIYSDAATTTIYTQGTPISKVYIKPSIDQLENSASWNLNATVNISNGCSATGITVIGNNSKVWNDTSTDWHQTKWKPVNSIPDANTCVIARKPVNVSIGNALAKNVHIIETGKVTVSSNRSLTVTDFVKNQTGIADNFVIESDANLIQINNVANIGPAKAERFVSDMDNVLSTQMDYVYWGTPVTGQSLTAFSPGTPTNRFFQYNETNDYFVTTADTNFVPAKGYAIRAEVSATLPANPVGYNKTYAFRGIPNNGDYNIDIKRSPDTTSGTPSVTYVHGYNLISNPYPSNIDFNVLYNANSTKIWNSVYFWTNPTYTYSQQGSSYAGNNYAVFSGVGGNPPTGGGYQNAPNGIIKVGQGFIVQKKNFGQETLNFKNSFGVGQNLRVATSGTFYQKDGNGKDRFWIKLISPDQVVNTQLIGYVEGSSNNFERDFDTEILDMSSDIFYSLGENRKLLIQGRNAVFSNEDAVPLGANFFKNGNYTIALENAEGVFSTSQNIYLKDKLLNTVTNLSQNAYQFSTNSGVNEGRFEIVYKPLEVLGTDNITKEDLTIIKDGNDFVIKSKYALDSIELYEASGRLVFSSKVRNMEVRIDSSEFSNGVYIVKAKADQKLLIKKLIK